MAIVVPFKALRPVREYARRVAALPYDVFSVEEARQQVRENPFSFLRVEKAESDFSREASATEKAVWERAKDNLLRMQDEGILRQDKAALFYLYRQQTGSHEQKGIAACVSVNEYNTGIIKTHEHTLEGKERERTLHVYSLGAQTGPVFLTYRGQPDISRMMSEVEKQDTEYDFVTEDGVRQTVWVISEPACISALEQSFLSVANLYIADGHHRAAAAARVAGLKNDGDYPPTGRREHDFIMAVLFPHDQLEILGYNRAVRDLNGFSEGEFLKRVEENFEISEDFQEKLPGRLHEFGMYLRGRWYLLSTREKALQGTSQAAQLDVSVLQDNVLGPILGIDNPRTNNRITFIGGSRGAAGLESVVDGNGFAVSFSLFPTTVEQMMTVADAGMVMPPKSTWFEPKLRSGLFVHLID
jgi:uncharacterized protein (DUF1015 family)